MKIQTRPVKVTRIIYEATLVSESGREYPMLSHHNKALAEGLGYLKAKTLKLCDECGAPVQLSEFNELYCPECVELF